METESRYLNTLELVMELDNIDLVRILGISILNRRENHEISENEKDSINEALAEIVAMMIAHGTYEDNTPTNAQADEIIEKATKLTCDAETIDIIHALFTNDEENQFANEGDCWVAYG
jgi:homoserine acetyltransferase